MKRWYQSRSVLWHGLVTVAGVASAYVPAIAALLPQTGVVAALLGVAGVALRLITSQPIQKKQE